MSALQSIEPNGHPDPATRAWASSGKPQMAYQCKDLDDVLSAVQYQIQTTAQGLIPEEVVCRFQLLSSASLEYPAVKAAERPSVGQDETPPPLRAADGGPIDPDPCPGYSIAAALSNFYDQKEKGNYQKVVAKAVVGAIQYADGFRWIIRRTKDTSTNDGLRLSYLCRDSIQNSSRPRKKVSSEETTEPTTTASEKDTYDCKGGIKLIFSIKNLCIDVFYHHVPVHDHADQLDKQRKMQKQAIKANDSPPAPPPSDEAMAAAHSFSYGMPHQQPQQPPEPPKQKRGRKKKGEVTISQANGSPKEKPKGTRKTKATAPATTTESKAKAPKQQPQQKQQPAKLTKQRAGTGSTVGPAKKRKIGPAESSTAAAGRTKPSPSKKSKKTKTTAS